MPQSLDIGLAVVSLNSREIDSLIEHAELHSFGFEYESLEGSGRACSIDPLRWRRSSTANWADCGGEIRRHESIIFFDRHWYRFHNFKLKLQFFFAKDGAEIELPELARKAKTWPALIEVHEQLQTESSPQIRQGYVNTDRPQLHRCRKEKAGAHRPQLKE